MKRFLLFYFGVLMLASSIFLPNIALADYQEISAHELKATIESGKVFLLNPLSDIEFNQGYIPGSVNIPLGKIMTTDRLPVDKNALIVTYCLGPK